ncbi:hypothetical protein DENSPDRAFT_528739 [Dentipellis sp. KUC8613]|nr:hypothetical protein DENSPDRAFT_528739 [Dentipellis sp. KUC8613]
MLLPPLNDDCCTIILSMLVTPDLAALSRVSQVAPSYVRPWLVRDLNIAGSHGTHFINRDIYDFIFRYALAPYIEVLKMIPRRECKPSFSNYFSRRENQSLVREAMNIIAEIVEAAVNIRSFRMDTFFGQFLEEDPRILISLQRHPRLRTLQLNGLRVTDVDSLLAHPISDLLCLQLSTSEAMDVQRLFEVARSSSQTLEELLISYHICPYNSPDADCRSAILASYPCLQRLLLRDIKMDPSGLSQVFPSLQNLKMGMLHDQVSPIILPTDLVCESKPNATPFNLLPGLRSIDGHSALLALPLYSHLQRLHISEIASTQESFEDLLTVMKCSPLISISLCIRARSPTEELSLSPNTWPFTIPYTISAVAKCVPLAQFLELSFNWGRFRPGLASGFSARTCLEWALSSESACAPLAALSDLRFVSFTVPAPGREYDENPPHMQDIADNVLCTLPTIKYLAMRSWGLLRHRLYFRRRKSSDGETLSSESAGGKNLAVQITRSEAHAAYLNYSWEATDLQGWCVGEHEWQ